MTLVGRTLLRLLGARSRRPTAAIGYAAFVSYSHAVDGKLAPAIQRGLERLTRPWWGRRALRVFRDDTGLAVTPELWGAITAALDQSGHLILLASPAAAQSSWVDREIEHWKRANPASRVLIVVTDGELGWDADRNDFDPVHSTALPPSLLGVFRGEPRWLDLRWARSEDQLDLRHSRFRDAIAQLASPLHGRPREDLDSDDVRRGRTARRVGVAGVVSLATLLVIALVAASLAVSNARQAEQRAREAVAGELAARAAANADQQPLSMLLSLERLRLADSQEARDTLFEGLVRPRHNAVVLPGHTGVVYSVAFSPDGSLLVSCDDDGVVRRWDPRTGAAVGEPIQTDSPLVTLALRRWNAATGKPVGEALVGHGYAVNGLAFTTGGTIVSAGFDGSVRRWNSGTGEPVGAPMPGATGPPFAHALSGNALAMDPTGAFIFSAAFDGTIRQWEGLTGSALGSPIEGPEKGSEKGALAVALSPQLDRIASTGRDGVVRLLSLPGGKAIGRPLLGHAGPANAVAFSPDGRTIASGGDDGTVRFWAADTGPPVGRQLSGQLLAERFFPISRMTFSPDGKTIASGGYDGTVRRWDVDTGVLVGEPFVGPAETVMTVAYSPDGDMIVSAGLDDLVRRWDVGGGAAAGPALAGHTGNVVAVAFNPDGKVINSASHDGSVRRWEARSGEPVSDPIQSGDALLGLALSPDGKLIAASGYSGRSTAGTPAAARSSTSW